MRPDVPGYMAVDMLYADLVWLETNRPSNQPIEPRFWRHLCAFAATGRGEPLEGIPVGRMTAGKPIIPPDGRTLGTADVRPVDAGTLSPGEPAPIATAGNPPDDAAPDIAQTAQPLQD